MTSFRRLGRLLGVVGLAAVALALSIFVAVRAVGGLVDAARAEFSFEGFVVAAVAFTFVVLTTPRVVRRLAEEG